MTTRMTVVHAGSKSGFPVALAPAVPPPEGVESVFRTLEAGVLAASRGKVHLQDKDERGRHESHPSTRRAGVRSKPERSAKPVAGR